MGKIRQTESNAHSEGTPGIGVGLEWLSEYGDRLYAYAYAKVGSAVLAEDLVQETLIAAIRSADHFAEGSSRGTWLIGILRHKIADHYRRHDPIRLAEALGEEPSVNAPRDFETAENVPDAGRRSQDPADLLSLEELRGILLACIAELPDRLREAFEKRVLEDRDARSSAKLLGISHANLAARLYRARLLLRDCVRRDWK